jgi:predicted PP-loop superfamily ATPase
MSDDDRCDACGGERACVWVSGRFHLCGKCASSDCMQLAVKIAIRRHKAKLQGILDEGE